MDLGVVLGPVALLNASKAKQKIRQFGVGREHGTKATWRQIMGWLALASFVLLLLFGLMSAGGSPSLEPPSRRPTGDHPY